MSGLDLFSGVIQGFAQTRERQKIQEQEKKERDAKMKLFEIQLQREQQDITRKNQQDTMRQSILGKIGSSGQADHAQSDPFNPDVNTQPAQKISLLDALTQNPAEAIGSGMVDAKDLINSQKTPDSITLLQALANNPKLAEVDRERRRASASQVNVGDQGMTKPPTGFFRPNPKSPGLAVEPGGPIDRERAVDFSAAQSAIKGSELNLLSLAQEAAAIRDDPNLWRITGPAGTLPNIPGSAAADLAARIETLKSKVAFGTLQAMRDASKTGGALGSVSEKELKLLESSLAALDQKQSPQAYAASLDRIITFATKSNGRMKDAFNATYGKQVAKSSKKISFADLPD